MITDELERLAGRGPHRDPARVIDDALDHVSKLRSRSRQRRTMGFAAVSVGLVVGLVAALAWLGRNDAGPAGPIVTSTVTSTSSVVVSPLWSIVDGDEVVPTDIPDGWEVDPTEFGDGHLGRSFHDLELGVDGRIAVGFGNVDDMNPTGEPREIGGIDWIVDDTGDRVVYWAIFDSAFVMISAGLFDQAELDQFVAGLRAAPAPEHTITLPNTIATPSTPTSTEPIAAETSTPVVPVTTAPPATASDNTVPVVEASSDVFIAVSGDRQAVIDVRDPTGVVATFDLGCPDALDCVVQSARVMGDTIWVAITDTEPDRIDAVVRSRVVSVMRSSGEVVEHLSHDGFEAVRSAGRGADGVLNAYLDGEQPADRQLVAIDGGEAQVLETGMSGFRLSDDGRYLAVSFSNPSAGEPARFEITDLVDQTTSGFQTPYINAGPAAWSPDGRYLIVDEQWEDQTAWIIDPWSGSGEPIAGTDRFLDGACFVNDRVIAHRTWNVGYGQGDAQPGVIRLTSLETGSTVAELGKDLFGDGFRCHPDGSISYLRRPTVEVQLSPDFSQLEPDYDAPVELVHISPDGTTAVVASGDLRLV